MFKKIIIASILLFLPLPVISKETQDEPQCTSTKVAIEELRKIGFQPLFISTIKNGIKKVVMIDNGATNIIVVLVNQVDNIACVVSNGGDLQVNSKLLDLINEKVQGTRI